MKRRAGFLLAIILLIIPLIGIAGEPETIYESDFNRGHDGWRGRGCYVSVTKEHTLLTERRENAFDGPGHYFNLIPGNEYVLSVEVRQKQVSSAEFIVSMEHIAGKETGWDNLAFGTVKKGKWTELTASFIAGEYDSYELYVETKSTPTLKYEIRNFKLTAPNGVKKNDRVIGRSIESLINSSAFENYDHDGMQIPLLSGEQWVTTDAYKGGYGRHSRFADKQTSQIVQNEFTVKNLTSFFEDPEKAQICYNSTQVDGRILEKESIEIDGHPAVIVIYDQYNQNNLFYAHCGVIFYVRQNRLVQIRIFSQSSKYYIEPEEIQPVTVDVMRKIAELVSYDISKAPVTEEEVAVNITVKDDLHAAAAGKSLELDAAFINPEKAKKESSSTNYDRFNWYVIDTETGEEVNEVQLNKIKIEYDRRHGVERGRATLASASAPTSHQKVQVSNKLDRVIYAEIMAESASFHTKASYPVILLPSIKKMTLEPAKVTLYAGTEKSEELKLSYDREDIPFVGLVWSVAKTGIVEIIPGENGTATIKPLAKGKTTATVTGPHGKKAATAINVVDPVEKIELSYTGTAKAGKKVNMKAVLLPKTAGVKDVEWSLDVDESIATINAKGVVAISRDTPAGTMITVTCTASGAPSPVISRISIEVE